jgi:hypothetical protein
MQLTGYKALGGAGGGTVLPAIQGQAVQVEMVAVQMGLRQGPMGAPGAVLGLFQTFSSPLTRYGSNTNSVTC